jgi:hypothetical protein
VRGQRRIKKRRVKPQPADSWGDSLGPRPVDNSRLAFCNINGFPVNPTNHKHHQIHHCMKKNEIQFFGLIELNLNFKWLGPKAQWHDRFQHAPKHHSQVAWNTHTYSKSRRNYGGVANISDADFTHKVIDSDNDPTGLGRWTWTSFREKKTAGHSNHYGLLPGCRLL